MKKIVIAFLILGCISASADCTYEVKPIGHLIDQSLSEKLNEVGCTESNDEAEQHLIIESQASLVDWVLDDLLLVRKVKGVTSIQTGKGLTVSFSTQISDPKVSLRSYDDPSDFQPSEAGLKRAKSKSEKKISVQDLKNLVSN